MSEPVSDAISAIVIPDALQREALAARPEPMRDTLSNNFRVERSVLL